MPEANPSVVNSLPAPTPAPAVNPGVMPPRRINVGLTLIFILISLLIGGAAVFVYFKTRALPQVTLAPSTLPQPSVVASPEIIPPSPHDLLYIKDGNPYHFSQFSNKEQQIATDGGQLISYSQPKWVDSNNVSFIRCIHKDTSGKTPYTCALVRQNLDGSSKQNLIERASSLNKNGVPVGAEFGRYSWNDSKTKLAYTAQKLTQAHPDFGELEVHLFDLTANSDQVLFSTAQIGGRGVLLDDDESLLFSPDNSKLLLVSTALYPNNNPSTDKGTVFVFDLATKTLLWQQPKTLTTFARWLTSDQLLAKQQAVGVANAPWNISQIDVVANKTNELGSAANIHKLEPTDINKAIYWVPQAASASGIQLEQIDLTNKTRTLIKENVLPLTVLTDGLLVQTVVPCSNKNNCTFDFYNGFEIDALGILNLTSKELKPLTIGKAAQSTSDFDVR